MTVKDKEIIKQKELIENAKDSDFYKNMLKHFPDAELIDIKPLKKNDE